MCQYFTNPLYRVSSYVVSVQYNGGCTAIPAAIRRTRATQRRAYSLEGVWYIASREPSDTPTPPGSQLSRICTQRHNTYNTAFFPPIQVWWTDLGQPRVKAASYRPPDYTPGKIKGPWHPRRSSAPKRDFQTGWFVVEDRGGMQPPGAFGSTPRNILDTHGGCLSVKTSVDGMS